MKTPTGKTTGTRGVTVDIILTRISRGWGKFIDLASLLTSRSLLLDVKVKEANYFSHVYVVF